MVIKKIIVGYTYDVILKELGNIKILGQVLVAKKIRSVKQQKEVLKANSFDENCLLIPKGTETETYQMHEVDFLKHAIKK